MTLDASSEAKISCCTMSVVMSDICKKRSSTKNGVKLLAENTGVSEIKVTACLFAVKKIDLS